MIDILIATAHQAGNRILDIYNDESLFKNIELKNDHSPLTLADKCSHEIIAKILETHFPDIPIISEEGQSTDYNIRKTWNRFWLVDPLDGTKEFIKRNGEFTVNIALIENNRPVAGVIQVPVSGEVYYADASGAYKISPGQPPKKLQVNNKTTGLIATGSRSHAGEGGDDFLSKYDIASFISAGSSLKFCYVAEGKADIYYRNVPTMEWDTAAGQVIVEKAGGSVSGLSYNKENLLNGNFCCFGFEVK